MKTNVEKVNEDSNYHKLAVLMEEKFNKIMDIMVNMCEAMVNLQQKSESGVVNGLEGNEGETTKKSKVVKRDVMTEFYNQVREKKLKLTNEVQEEEVFLVQTNLAPESDKMLVDTGEG